ncbi:IncF plasmid conjugative transfer protein TrbH [Escherichia coli ISC7]|uniref:IncF plasmid conjugative transfer protein TrbH n=1 Tax=Escherichia coli ISC7 TaxID=1432555 RepID=W1EV90_ECOLX|nr:IncF plasmid conjugative transfer protein TrbH [Escherichia coli ISC7]
MPGCSLLSIKSALTLCPSNHSSHVSPAGVMILVRPTAITSTRFYVFRQCNRFWQSDRLAAVAEKYGGFHYLPPYVDMSCVYPLWD